VAQTRFTSDIADEIVEHIKSFVSLETACALVGERVETVRGWLRRGADARSRLDLVTEESRAFADFHKRVEGAIARQKQTFAKLVQERAQDIPTGNGGVSRGDVKPLADLMAVLHPREFNRAVRVEVEGELAASIDKLIKHLPPEIAEQAIAALARDDDDAGREENANADDAAGAEGAGQDRQG
jgi:2-keto-4-pentenoate hydratase/2-oxohepta-3-ene-1,7-dioic acid hydratase in catechol pathway